jgi:glycine cleavage system H protein
MNVPANLKYTKEHEWIRLDGTTAFVGITDYAQSELGEIVFVEVETIGETLAEGDVFGTVEAVKTVSDLYLPIDGKVLEFNTGLEDKPELVNEDPYGEGWMVKIEVSNTAQVDSLLSAAEYEALIGA